MTDQGVLENLREAARQALTDDGFTPLPAEFSIGNIDFDQIEAFAGPTGTLSLVLLLAAPSSREESSRIYWLAQRLVRALDALSSKRSLTVVTIGAPPEDRLATDLQTIARVLWVDGSLPVRRLLAPLLKLPTIEQGTNRRKQDHLQSLLAGRSNSEGLSSIAAAARSGSTAVEAAYVKWIDASLVGRHPNGKS